MSDRIALGMLGVASPCIVVASFVDHPIGTVALAALVLAFPAALIALGSAGARRPPRWLPLATALVLEGSGLAILLLDRLGTPWRLGGLPVGTVVLLLGIGAFPLLLVAGGYALAFDEPEGRSEPGRTRAAGPRTGSRG